MSEIRLVPLSAEDVDRFRGIAAVLSVGNRADEEVDFFRSIVTAYEQGITEEEARALGEEAARAKYGVLLRAAVKLRFAFGDAGR